MLGTFAQHLGAALGAPLFSTGNALAVRYFFSAFGADTITARPQARRRVHGHKKLLRSHQYSILSFLCSHSSNAIKASGRAICFIGSRRCEMGNDNSLEI